MLDDLDIDWTWFSILAGIGFLTCAVMLVIWGRMDYNPGIVTKVGMFIVVPIGAFIFSKIFARD